VSWWQERKDRKRRERLRDLKVRAVRTRDALGREEKAHHREDPIGRCSRKIGREINRILGDTRKEIPDFVSQIPDDLPPAPEASYLTGHLTLAQLALVLDAVRSKRPTPAARVLLAQRARIQRLLLEKQDASFQPDASLLRCYGRLVEDADRLAPALAAELRLRVPPEPGRATLLSKLDLLAAGLGHRQRHRALTREGHRVVVADDPDRVIGRLLTYASTDPDLLADAFAPDGPGYRLEGITGAWRIRGASDVPDELEGRLPEAEEIWIVSKEARGASALYSWLPGLELRALVADATRLRADEDAAPDDAPAH